MMKQADSRECSSIVIYGYFPKEVSTVQQQHYEMTINLNPQVIFDLHIVRFPPR